MGSPSRPNSGEILAKIKNINFELLEILAKINHPEKIGPDLTLRGEGVNFITPVVMGVSFR